MKKFTLSFLLMFLGISLFAQTSIQLRSTNRAECVKSDMTSLKASFSFSTIEAENMETKGGQFSWLSMPNTVIGGNEGDPQIPVINELIAVPFGAQPTISVTSYSATDYQLNDLGIETLIPRQPSLRKDQKPEDVPFIKNEAAYQSTRGLRSEPMAVVNVVGTMRGVRLGKMTIEPVSYDPVNNTLRVFNNIEVEVNFDGADAKATEDMLVKTYSPYFDIVYKQLFNGRSVKDAYSAHPDLYTTPVKMLVVTTSTYANCEAFQNWLIWKTQKGIDVDVQTVANGASATTIQSLIYSRYNANHPTFLVIVGDETVVTYFSLWDYDSTYGDAATDLEYASVDGDVYHDMFISRMSVSSTTELSNLVNKILTYEQYTMSDPSYLNNVLLIAGADGTWAPKVGRPTINYAADNYFNTSNGFTNVYKYVSDTYTGCYNYLSSGVGFANYTAHGDIQEWHNPNFTNDDVNALTNNDKYFWAMGNCCLTCNFKNVQNNQVCYGEAMIRAANKAAFGYIGSVPESYWWEDYYFGVGATSTTNQTPTMSQTQTGVYDAMFDDTGFNTLNAVPYVGNVAVTFAHAGSYQSSVTDEYYWRAYQCFGDGSVMPYHTQPAANNVSHATTIGIGLDFFTVNADAGSYVAISKDNVLLGAAQVDESGIVNVPITPITSGGDVLVVVTRQQRQPYMQTIQAVSLEGPYISLDGYTPNAAHVGDNTNLSITFKNVGADATVGNTIITLTSNDVEILQGVGSFGALDVEATTTVSGFSFKIAEGVADGTNVTIHYVAENGDDTYEGNIVVKANEAKLEYAGMAWDGGFTPGETLTLSAKFKNTGHYQATNAKIALSSSSNYITFSPSPVIVGTIEAGQVITYDFSVTIADNCPETEVIPVTFTMTADGNLSATGNENLKNACNVIFELHDSYSGNDGWNNAKLTVSFDDGTPAQDLTIASGSNAATYTLEIGNGTHVTLTWTKGSYDNECSFTVSYEGDLTIYQMAASSNPSAGVLYEFDCNCAAATQTFTVNVSSSNTNYGTVSGGGEFSFGESCTVTATPADGYMFTSWTVNGEVVSTNIEYTFNVTNNVNLVANFTEGTMIGDGGSSTSDYLPSHSNWKYSLSQQIYTSAELGGEGFITSIAFYNGGTTKTRTIDFYLKATTKNTFSGSSDWVTVTESDKVFSGQVTMTAGEWTFVTLTNPYIYDGNSNLVLVTDDNTGSYSSGMGCRVFNASSQALYKYSDTEDYNPFAPSSYSGTVLNVKNQIIITKEAFSDCMRPTGLTATEVGPNFVKLSWNENGASEQWYVVYGDTFVIADTNEDFLLEGLDPETEYSIMVRPVCDENLFSNAITVTTLEACPAPQIVEMSNITHNSATVTWGDFNDSYNVQLGIPAFLISEDFANAIPTDWTNDASYPWTIVDGHIQSGNAGTSNTTSSISVTVTYPSNGTLSFDFWSRGEGSDSNDWDKCRFYIDNELMFDYGQHTEWESYSADITAGNHTFTWTYKKDGSVNPTGDYFAVDNVMMKAGETVWNNPIAVDAAEYRFTGLNPETTYYVRVQGICDDTETEWSDILMFNTQECSMFTKDIVGYGNDDNAGGYYLIASPIGEVNPEEVENMLQNSFDLFAFDQDETEEWRNYKANTFNLAAGQGFLYANSENVTLTFTGSPYNGNGQVTLKKTSDTEMEGWNLVGNPFAETAYLDRDFYVMNDNGSEIVAAERNNVEAMEGVFVIAQEDSEALVFSTTPISKGAALVMNITRDSRGSVIDRAIVRFNESQSLPKFQIKENSTKLFIQQDGKDFAVVSTEVMGEMPVNFKAGKNGTYTIGFHSENVDFSYLHLIDNMTGADIDLLEQPSYSFNATITDYASRFKLVFATGNATDDNFAFYNNGQIIFAGVNDNAIIQVIDVTGRIILNRRDNAHAISTEGLRAGAYMLRLIDGNDVKIQKIVVE